MGRSQAMRFTSTTTLGGKAGWAPATRLHVKTREAVAEKAMSPLADDLSWRVQARADRIVAQPGCGEEHNLGADNITIR
jgi:hypothetical protein